MKVDAEMALGVKEVYWKVVPPVKDERGGRIGQEKDSDHPTALNLRKAKGNRGRN